MLISELHPTWQWEMLEFWRCWIHVFGTLGSCLCVNERKDGPDALEPRLVLSYCTGSVDPRQ